MSWNIKTPGDYINGPLTVAGSATITGDLTVDTSTLKVDSANNRVGIGATTPAYKLEVATGTSGQQALASFRTADTTAANNAGIQIYATPSSTAASRSVLLSLDADGADASGGDYFIIQKLGNSGQVDLTQQSNAAMTFSTNGTERARITASGDVNITTGNVVMSTSGKGIDFSATANSSGTMTSELLADYEEGTFTPNIGGTATYTAQVGRYTKIGNRVHGNVRIAILLKGTGSDYEIGGLPFAVGSSVAASVSVGYFTGLATAVNYISAYASSVAINMTGTTATTANITNAIAVIGNTTDLNISFSYEV